MNLRECSVFALALTFLAYGAAGQCPTAPGPVVVPAEGKAGGTPPIGANMIAQTFIAPGTGCLQVQSVQIQALGDTPVGDLIVSIYTVDTTGKPVSQTGASATIPLFDSGGLFVPKTAEFLAPVQIAGGVTYAVVFTQPATTNGSHHYELRSMQAQGGVDPYEGGKLWVNGGAWEPQTNKDVLMTVTFTCCPTGCTRTQGYWQNHYPELWPAFGTMLLGSVAYTPAQLEAIYLLPSGGKGGANGLIILAHQLITAKLNILAGAPQAPISGTIASADALIGTQNPLSSGYLSPDSVSSLSGILDSYNNGELSGGPPHCQ